VTYSDLLNSGPKNEGLWYHTPFLICTNIT